MGKKVIFLDIDGVLNNFKTPCDVIVEHHDLIQGVDTRKVKRLAKIVEATGASIILSSDWRYGWYADGEGNWMHANYLNKKFAKENLIIEEKTPYNPITCERGPEIHQYLQEHPEVTDWVILEDTDWDSFYEYPDVMRHWVHTDGRIGLTEKDAAAAISILEGNLLDWDPVQRFAW